MVGFNKFIEWINRHSERLSLCHAIMLSCLFALISILYSCGGNLYGEMYARLPFYMSDIPLLNKLFDSRILDDQCYRARELSYFLDVIDFKFVKFSIENGFPHFLSLTHYVLSIITGCVLWLFCVKELNLKPFIGTGWLALFWTSPGIFLSALNRTGKIWVTFLTSMLFYGIYRVASASRMYSRYMLSKGAFFGLFLIMLIMTFLDEQGIFFVITAMIVLAVWNCFVRNRHINMMLLTGVAILIFHALYRHMIAPALTLLINGYRPDFTFQEMPIGYFIQNMGVFLSSGISLYMDNVRFLTGNPPPWMAYGLISLALFFAFYYVRNGHGLLRKDRKFCILASMELLIINLLIVLMHALMVVKSPNLVLAEFRRIYYWSPTIILLTMSLAILTGIACKSRTGRWLAAAAMCLAFAGNIVALPKHKSVITDQGYFEPYIESGRKLLLALQDMRSPKWAGEPLVARNPVFQFIVSQQKDNYDGADLYNAKGLFLAYLGLHQLAVEDFYMAIGLKENSFDAPDRVIAYRELNKQWPVTENDVNVERIKQAYAEAYNNRGINAANHGKKALAAGFFSEAITLKQDFAFAYSNRGVMYFALGNERAGCADAHRACFLNQCAMLDAAKSRGLCLP